MKVDILHNCHPLHPFSGNIFYQFEYYIYLLQRGVDVRMVFTPGYDVNHIIEVMEDRYDLDGIDYRGNITSDGVTTAPNVITTTKVIYDLAGGVKAERLFVVGSWVSYGFGNEVAGYLKGRNVTLYNECPECGEVNYTRPIYFDLLKKPVVSDDAVYLHISSNSRGVTAGEYINYIKPHIGDRKTITSCTEEQYKKMFFIQNKHISHIKGLFSKFDTYLYILLKTKDYSPRMIMESKYLGKDIIYINTVRNTTSVNRYNDCMSNNLEKYHMRDSDPLLRNFI